MGGLERLAFEFHGDQPAQVAMVEKQIKMEIALARFT
jgi:hypothetical protein